MIALKAKILKNFEFQRIGTHFTGLGRLANTLIFTFSIMFKNVYISKEDFNESFVN